MGIVAAPSAPRRQERDSDGHDGGQGLALTAFQPNGGKKLAVHRGRSSARCRLILPHLEAPRGAKELCLEGQTTVYKVGFGAAALASVFSIVYDIGQLAAWFGLMGSGGGPERDSTWLGLIVLLVPSLLLGIAFVVLMGSVHRHAPTERKIWSQTGLTFAIMYGTLICMNYFVQLTLIAPALRRGNVPSRRSSPRSSSPDRGWRRWPAGS